VVAETLVEDGKNGFVFDPFSTDAIAETLCALASHPNRSGMGIAGQRRVMQWDPKRFGDAMVKAVETATRRGVSRPSAIFRATLMAAAFIQGRRS
jgi:glycosyltransferase involved in cell wall biosynthesis